MHLETACGKLFGWFYEHASLTWVLLVGVLHRLGLGKVCVIDRCTCMCECILVCMTMILRLKMI